MSRVDSFSLAAQEDWGVPNTTMDYTVPVESVDVSHNQETIEVDETTGTRFPTRIERGTRFGELSATGLVRAISFGRIASAFFGLPDTAQPDAVGSPTVYRHTFDPAASGKAPIPHTIVVAREDPDPAIVDQFNDCIGNEMTLSVEPNGILTFSASFVARDSEEVASPSPTSDFSRRFPFHQASVFLKIGEDAEEEIPTAAWSWTYSNNVPTDVFVLGLRTLWELREDNATSEVSFSPRSELNEHHRQALGDEPGRCRLRFVATGPIIEDTFAWQIEVIQYLLEYTDAPANVSAAERMRLVEVTARAAYDDVAGKFIDLVLTNTVEDYDQPVAP